MTDLDAALVMARDTVQHYSAALAALHDDDLRELPGSPSNEPPVGGTRTRQAPYTGDGGLRRRIMSAAVDLHVAACELLASSLTDEVGAWEQPPMPDVVAFPGLSAIIAHVDQLDDAYRRLQSARLPSDAAVVASSTAWVLDSHALCATVEGPDGERHLVQPPAVARIWQDLQRIHRPTCHLCGRLDHKRSRTVREDGTTEVTTIPTAVHGRICAACRADARGSGEAADGREDRCRLSGSRPQCRTHIDHPRLGLCRSCAQAERDARRGKSPGLRHLNLVQGTTAR